MNNWRDRISIKWLVAGFGCLVVVIVLIMVLVSLLKTNPYGPEVVIDNFGEFYSDVSEDRRFLVQASLYKAINSNVSNVSLIPESGAVIRNGSAIRKYNEDESVWAGDFIVDIEVIRQSYKGHFVWAENNKNALNEGYIVLFTCLNENDLIYGDFDCKDMFSDDISTKFPITTKLPLTVSEYSNNYTKYVNFSISYTINDDHSDITLVINDYVGNGREDALKKIRDLGYDPEDYEINYKNVSSEYEMNYVGN